MGRGAPRSLGPRGPWHGLHGEPGPRAVRWTGPTTAPTRYRAVQVPAGGCITDSGGPHGSSTTAKPPDPVPNRVIVTLPPPDSTVATAPRPVERRAGKC